MILSMGLATFPSYNSAMLHLCHGGDRCDLPQQGKTMSLTQKFAKYTTSLFPPCAYIGDDSNCFPCTFNGVLQRTYFFSSSVVSHGAFLKTSRSTQFKNKGRLPTYPTMKNGQVKRGPTT